MPPIIVPPSFIDRAVGVLHSSGSRPTIIAPLTRVCTSLFLAWIGRVQHGSSAIAFIIYPLALVSGAAIYHSSSAMPLTIKKVATVYGSVDKKEFALAAHKALDPFALVPASAGKLTRALSIRNLVPEVTDVAFSRCIFKATVAITPSALTEIAFEDVSVG